MDDFDDDTDNIFDDGIDGMSRDDLAAEVRRLRVKNAEADLRFFGPLGFSGAYVGRGDVDWSISAHRDGEMRGRVSFDIAVSSPDGMDTVLDEAIALLTDLKRNGS